MISFSTDSTNGGCPIGKIKDAEYGGDLQTGPWNRQTVPRSDPPMVSRFHGWTRSAVKPWTVTRARGFTVNGETVKPCSPDAWPTVPRSTAKLWSPDAWPTVPRSTGKPWNRGTRNRGTRTTAHCYAINRETGKPWSPDRGPDTSTAAHDPRPTVKPWSLTVAHGSTVNRETLEPQPWLRKPWSRGTSTVPGLIFQE